jgi:hypothetical protein
MMERQCQAGAQTKPPSQIWEELGATSSRLELQRTDAYRHLTCLLMKHPLKDVFAARYEANRGNCARFSR